MLKYISAFIFIFFFSSESVCAGTGDTIKCDSAFTIKTSFTFNREENYYSDPFLPHFDSLPPVLFSMSIFDRWGVRVFSTKSLSQGWNGRKNNRYATLKDGTYYWIMYYKMKDEFVTHSCTGFVQCYGMDYLPSIEIQDTVQCDTVVYIPNAFTTNGDGINDTFQPRFLCPPYYFEIWIFDRWGNLIFYSDDPIKGWDGTNQKSKSRENMQQDVYVYKVKFSFFRSDIKRQHVGQVTLLR